MANNQTGYFLKLSSQPILFEPIATGTSVFYDKDNQQLFCVRGSGAMGVIVKGQRHEQAYSFRLEDKGAIQSIKFNPDLSVLAIKRNSNSVEFLNFAPIQQSISSTRNSTSSSPTIMMLETDKIEYSQLMKVKSTKFYDFNWLSDKEIVFVTDKAIEHYLLNVEKRALRLIKHHLIDNIYWQLFSREMNLLIVYGSLPSSSNTLIPFSFHKIQQQQLTKLPKFDVDLPQVASQRSSSTLTNSTTQSTTRRSYELTERDCMLVTIYGKTYLLIIRQVSRVPGQPSMEVVFYQIEDDQKPAQKRHILRLNLPGKCALNIVDNLVLIHHQPTKATYIYDIEESSTSQNDGFQTIHEPLLSQLTIQPVNVNWPVISPTLPTTTPTTVELYSSNWIVFLPNVIIDVKMGCLWYLLINLDYLIDAISNPVLLTHILLRRMNGKSTILTLLRILLTNVIAPVHIDSNDQLNLSPSVTVDLWIEIVDRINRVFIENSPNRPLVDQSDIHSVVSLFSNIVPTVSIDSSLSNDMSPDDANNTILKFKFAINILIEYIRSLNDYNIPVQYQIYELLVNLFIRNNQFFQLKQLIQYQILTDSIELACLLLSLSSKQQPTTQIALDMLKRLTTANEEIVEILLGHNHIIEALQFSVEHLPISRTLARKLLEAAVKADELLSSTSSNQKIIFFTVYTFFEEYFQRTNNASSSNQLAANNNEQKDALESFKVLFNTYFRNQDTDITHAQ